MCSMTGKPTRSPGNKYTRKDGEKSLFWGEKKAKFCSRAGKHQKRSQLPHASLALGLFVLANQGTKHPNAGAGLDHDQPPAGSSGTRHRAPARGPATKLCCEILPFQLLHFWLKPCGIFFSKMPTTHAKIASSTSILPWCLVVKPSAPKLPSQHWTTFKELCGGAPVNHNSSC